MIGTGRVWATSAIRAPSVITICTPRRSAASTIASAKVRQRTFGSTPLSSTRSRSALGTLDGQQRVLGPVDLAGLPLDQADRRPVDLKVVELLRVDPRHDVRVERRRDGLQRRARRARGVVPAREGADQGGRAKLGRIALPDHRIHGASLLENRALRRRRLRRACRGEPSGPAFTIEAWKRRWRSRRPSGRSPRSPSCGPGQRFEGRYACLRKDRLTARNGGAYLSFELRDRTGTLAARVFREADRIGLRFERGDAVLRPRQARALQRRVGGRARRRAAARARVVRPGRVPARRLPLGRGARGLPRAPVRARSTTPACAASSSGCSFAEPAGQRVSPRPVHPGRASRLPRRAARAHGLGGDAGRRALPAPSQARLRPADGGGARSRHRQDARVHLRGGVRGQRRGPAARPPGDRGADGRRGGRPAASRAPAGAAPLRALAPRPGGRPRARRRRRPGRAASPHPRRWPSTG